jgi:hypothetical protein
MSKIKQTYDRILGYLKNLLTNRERHDLEQELMHDVFDEEAFTGLSQLSGEELEADMVLLMNRLDNRLEARKKRNLLPFYRIAATILLLVGISGIFFWFLRTPSENLITQKTEQPVSQTPVTTLPVEAPESEAVKVKEADTQKKSETKSTPKITQPEQVLIEAEVAEMEVLASEDYVVAKTPDEPMVEESNMEEEMAMAKARDAISVAPAVAKEKKTESLRIRGVSTITPSGVLSGKVVDNQGQPLPGVNVIVKGTDQGAVTDLNGFFTLNPADDNGVFTLSYIGYNSLELDRNEINGKVITMTEDVQALNEVVVVGYGTRKSSQVTGAIANIEARDVLPSGEPIPNNYFKPVPPDGSLKEFKNWVESLIDHKQFISFPGKYKIQVNFTVHTDGSLSDVVVKNNVPSPIAEEYRRIISQSPLWQAALKNNTPVEAEIVVKFMLEVN